MKGLAIYTIVMYGLAMLGILYEPSAEGFIGLLALAPMLAMGILYLVRDAQKRKATIPSQQGRW